MATQKETYTKRLTKAENEKTAYENGTHKYIKELENGSWGTVLSTDKIRSLIEDKIKSAEYEIEVCKKNLEKINAKEEAKAAKVAMSKFENMPDSFKALKPLVKEMAETESDIIAESFIVAFFGKVHNYTKGGEIVRRIGSNGAELVGIVIGEAGTFEVRTIVAGGWNIQRMHTRTIVTPA